MTSYQVVKYGRYTYIHEPPREVTPNDNYRELVNIEGYNDKLFL